MCVLQAVQVHQCCAALVQTLAVAGGGVTVTLSAYNSMIAVQTTSPSADVSDGEDKN